MKRVLHAHDQWQDALGLVQTNRAFIPHPATTGGPSHAPFMLALHMSAMQIDIRLSGVARMLRGFLARDDESVEIDRTLWFARVQLVQTAFEIVTRGAGGEARRRAPEESRAAEVDQCAVLEYKINRIL